MKTKKELKNEYKQMKFKIGVFKLSNLINGKIFIGSSLDLIANWNSLRLQLDLGSHPNRQLQDDWKNFGQDNFDYQILEELPQPEDYTGDYRKDVKTLEELILDELEPYDEKGYNVRKKVYSFNR